MSAGRVPLWKYPPPSHPRRQRLWRLLHPVRHARFRGYLDGRIDAELIAHDLVPPKETE